MCGIFGIVSNNKFSSMDLISGLKRLEYRGYDSAGIAMEGNGIYVEKSVGEIPELEKQLKIVMGKVGIAHTRWSTHGGVTQQNAHPHSDCRGEIFIVHNGIISNYADLKQKLISRGHKFLSETDSEVIAHFFEEELKTQNMRKAAAKFFEASQGEFAILLIRKDDNTIYAFKKGSPLCIGLGEGMNIVASDVYAFADKVDNVIFLNEDEYVEVTSDTTSDDFEIFHYYPYSFESKVEGNRKVKIAKADPSLQPSFLEHYDHYMIKEIMEQPAVASRLLSSLHGEQLEKMQQLKSAIESSKRVVFVAAGTSYHASLLGVYFLNKTGIEAHTIIASEFKNFTLLDENTLVIAVSQSGETMDLIEALHGIKAKGVKISSLVNVPYSTVQRMSNLSINICAGQEVCVAATKTFVNQVITLLYLASMFGYKAELEKLPQLIEELLKRREQIKSIAKQLKDNRDIYIIGRGFSYPVAREIALKLKEISYIHAEGMMGGELKHGTLALIEKGTPVIVLMPKSDADIVSNSKEVEARGAKIIAFSENGIHENRIHIPAIDKPTFSILAAIAGQLLTYYIAKEKGLPIDKPRNLAKSVTVK